MNLKSNIFIAIILLLCFSFNLKGQEAVECWDKFELTFNHIAKGNPYQNVKVSATFTRNGEKKIVSGFYDGDNTYKIRFMPTSEGKWNYTTSSNVSSMNNKKGSLNVVPAKDNNHGMVVVDGEHNFKYADGTRFYPMGTTSYAWTHMPKELEDKTVETLKKSGFNKLRMCVFPKNYNLVKEEPLLYPYEIKGVTKDKKGNEVKEWDFDKFNPEFFQHLEQRIDQLQNLGIEVDLILFHPYDKGRWGFDAMSNDVNIKYIKYITARLGSYRNIWWSMANEWDYVKAKTVQDWDLLSQAVVDNDPYRHLCSIHGATATYYDYWKPQFTHVSIQDETPVMSTAFAATLRNIYRKPVICDEVGYEGNLINRWGRLSPQKMTHLIVNGLMGGVYVTHGECYQEGTDPIFWAQGGELKGESWKRVQFLNKILDAMPNPLEMADISRDFVTSTAGNGYYFVNLGADIQESWTFNLPSKNADYAKLTKGKRFKVDIIDVWAMTITECPLIFETSAEIDYRIYDKDLKNIRLPDSPYLLLRIVEIK